MSGVLFGLVQKRKALALKAMLDAGSSPMTVNMRGSTMLMESVKNQDVETASVLIQHGGKALIDMQDFEGNTALHFAFDASDNVMSSFLVTNGADEEQKNMYGLVPRQGLKITDFSALTF